MARVLVIRFSSFGDIIQALSVVKWFKRSNIEVDWITKKQFETVVRSHPDISEVISFDRLTGLVGLFRLGLELRRKNYEYVYDAHSNLRSFLLVWILSLAKNIHVWRRPKNRIKRFLFFYFGINCLPKPFKGMQSYLDPLERSSEYLLGSQKLEFLNSERINSLKQEKPFLKSDYICFAPSAAWPMKTWPKDHWIDLIKMIKTLKKDFPILILGGPDDKFCQEFEEFSSQIVNLAGKLSLEESCWVVQNAKLLISADTGLIHVADLVGTQGLSLIGPTAFGFPTHTNIKVLDVPLGCRPCSKDGRGKCQQEIYQRCMVEISPERVFKEIKNIIFQSMSFSSPKEDD